MCDLRLPAGRGAILILLPALCAACSGEQDGGAPALDPDAASDAVLPDGTPPDAPQDGGFPPDASDEPIPDVSADDAPTDAVPADAPTETSQDASDAGAVDGGPASPFQVFVDTAGDDGNDGSSPSNAVLTLERVHAILEAEAPDRDVEVRIAQGTYTGQSVTWTYYHPDHAISFLPIDYQPGGGIGSIAGRPVFDGEGAGALLTLDAADGRPTNLAFIYLQIERYRVFGLHFRGNRNDFDQGWNGGNRVFGCVITHVGNLANAGDPGYGGLDLVNSRDNEIRNNHFLHVENASGSGGLMHALYLAHGSSQNDIRANRFVGISGDPVRLRDGSNHNQVVDNVLETAGSVAFISDWWCDKDANPNCTKPSGECPSWENAFRDNELHCGYDGGTIATFHYFQGEDYVPAWCVDHGAADGWARIRTSGNTKACP